MLFMFLHLIFKFAIFESNNTQTMHKHRLTRQSYGYWAACHVSVHDRFSPDHDWSTRVSRDSVHPARSRGPWSCVHFSHVCIVTLMPERRAAPVRYLYVALMAARTQATRSSHRGRANGRAPPAVAQRSSSSSSSSSLPEGGTTGGGDKDTESLVGVLNASRRLGAVKPPHVAIVPRRRRDRRERIAATSGYSSCLRAYCTLRSFCNFTTDTSAFHQMIATAG